MDPFSWIAIAMLLSAAGAATSFAGSRQAAAAAEDAGKMQQQAAEAEARNEELQAAENTRRERVNKRRRLARIRAESGGSGLTAGGSMGDVFQETAGLMELEIQDGARAGAMNAGNLRSQGNMAMWEARNQAIGTRISSYGTLLSSGAALGGQASRNGW